ncbi:hypothetical protein MNBD_PLANCTO03-904 [hydrothermal vent metagenome]|uniref:Uncharacterized protein n=1 Tax=hydrothermal vent metagenome TaxID=652676 RepID=A0A3B1DVE4_9ZZZZ
MQRGFAAVWFVVMPLAASIAHAQAGVNSPDQRLNNQDSNKQSMSAPRVFVGPLPLVDTDEYLAEESSADQPLKAAAVESLPLGQGPQSSFRARLESGGHLETTPASGGTPSLKVGEGWWRTAGALVIIIVLILAAAAIVRQLVGRSGGLLHAMGAGGRSPSGLLHVLGRYPIGRGQTLILLKLDRRIMLVCQSVGTKGGGMRTICEINDPEEVASIVLHTAEAEGRTLSNRFREMVSGFESSHSDTESVVQPVEMPAERRQDVAAAPDPVGRLHSRLNTLRAADWEGSA